MAKRLREQDLDWAIREALRDDRFVASRLAVSWTSSTSSAYKDASPRRRMKSVLLVFGTVLLSCFFGLWVWKSRSKTEDAPTTLVVLRQGEWIETENLIHGDRAFNESSIARQLRTKRATLTLDPGAAVQLIDDEGERWDFLHGGVDVLARDNLQVNAGSLQAALDHEDRLRLDVEYQGETGTMNRQAIKRLTTGSLIGLALATTCLKGEVRLDTPEGRVILSQSMSHRTQLRAQEEATIAELLTKLLTSLDQVEMSRMHEIGGSAHDLLRRLSTNKADWEVVHKRLTDFDWDVAPRDVRQRILTVLVQDRSETGHSLCRQRLSKAPQDFMTNELIALIQAGVKEARVEAQKRLTAKPEDQSLVWVAIRLGLDGNLKERGLLQEITKIRQLDVGGADLKLGAALALYRLDGGPSLKNVIEEARDEMAKANFFDDMPRVRWIHARVMFFAQAARGKSIDLSYMSGPVQRFAESLDEDRTAEVMAADIESILKKID